MVEHVYKRAADMLRNGGLLGAFGKRLEVMAETMPNTKEGKIAGLYVQLMGAQEKLILSANVLAPMFPVLVHFLGDTQRIRPAMSPKRLEFILENVCGWRPVSQGNIRAYEVKL